MSSKYRDEMSEATYIYTNEFDILYDWIAVLLNLLLNFRGDKAVARSPSSRIEKIINKAPFITTHSFQHYNDIRLSDK